MDIYSLLHYAKEHRASDVHIVAGTPPMVRIHGSLETVADSGPLSPEETLQAFYQIATPEGREEFHRGLELDFGFSLDGVGRLRVNVAQERKSVSILIRLLPPELPVLEKM